jgi:hypothetical protein
MNKLFLTSILFLILGAFAVAAQEVDQQCYDACKRDCIAGGMFAEDCAKLCTQKCTRAAAEPMAAEPVSIAPAPEDECTKCKIMMNECMNSGMTWEECYKRYDCAQRCWPEQPQPEPMPETCEAACKRLAMAAPTLTAARAFNQALYEQCVRERCKREPPRPMPQAMRELHYKCYEIEEIRADVRLPQVQVDDQFGTEYLKVIRPELLCTPAWKEVLDGGGGGSSREQAAAADTAAADITGAVSHMPQAVSVSSIAAAKATPGIPAVDQHWKCYEIEELKADVHYPEVRVTDQFGVEYLRILKPRLLCTPARKKHMGAVPPPRRPPVREVKEEYEKEYEEYEEYEKEAPPPEVAEAIREERPPAPKPAGFWRRFFGALGFG